MSQHAMTLNNQPGASFRTDLNNAIAALVSNSSGATSPAVTFAYMTWADTTSGLMKQRNAANSAWIEKGELASVDWGFLKKSNPVITGLLNLDDGADIASASTVDLTAATGNTIRITGTTAITAFTMNAGQQMELVAVGALPLTYNATTMNISGGVSYTCAAGDRLKVFKDGAGVVRVNVTKQDGSAVTQSSSASSFKNKIIGGDFATNPWQRGTTFAAIADAAYSADRWQYRNTSAGVASVLKTADSPTAAQSGTYSTHCLHVDVTTADIAIAAGDLMAVRQKIEGLNSASLGFGQAGVRYVTLSFWHKHTKTGTHCVALRNSAANRSYVAEYTQSVTDAWELATVIIAVDTSGTWLYDTGVGLDVVFALAAGSTYQTAANAWAAGDFWATSNQVNNLDNVANNFKIALVQLELNQQASSFEARSATQEEALCYRYYEAPTHQVTVNNTANISYRSLKRAVATVSVTTTSGASVSVSVSSYVSPHGFRAQAASPGDFTWTASAEL